ncbi:MAG: hypothetical protein Fur0037_16660 [Planctomycetota bacterium]
MRRLDLLSATLAMFCSSLLPSQNCAGGSVGLTPLDDPAGFTYGGFAGGLYGNGSNAMPAAHRALGLAASAAVQPLDAAGVPASAGRIVLLSIGMSNATQEFSTFVPISNADPNRSPAVVPVDGAQGGQTAAIIQDPLAPFWGVVDQRLAAAGVTTQQVQVVWLKDADARPTASFPAHAVVLQQEFGAIARVLHGRYPNVRLCFLSSRSYAGYATSNLNPEPYAYESGFAVQWLLQQQMSGDPLLNCDPARGPVTAPWLGWGPYLWADGLVPRQSDGLTWLCSDFGPDGTHPSAAGRAKVASMLQAFFSQNELARPWYSAGMQLGTFSIYGSGCPGSHGIPEILSNSPPRLGTPGFAVGVRSTAPGRLALLSLSIAPSDILLAQPCRLLVDPAAAIGSLMRVTSATGRSIVPMPIPNDPLLIGAGLFLQWGIDDPAGSSMPPLAGLAMTAGARLIVGP